VRVALVVSAKASEPEAASDKAKAPRVSVARRGSHCARSSGEPHIEKVLLTIVL